MIKCLLGASIALFFIAATVMEAKAERRIGGLGDAKPADDKVQSLVDSLKPHLTSKIHGKSCASHDEKVCEAPPTSFRVVSYKTQLVSGTNYFVKLIASGEGKDVVYHARIWEQPWTNTLELTEVDGPHEESTEIEYF